MVFDMSKYKIPKDINFLLKFLTPYEIDNINFDISNKNIDEILYSIDKLLWEWHSPLSREWYPYLYNLKQDFVISFKNHDKEIIFKTQTLPFCYNFLKNNNIKS